VVGWQPNWSDVSFDRGAALAAAQACRSAAAQADAVAGGLGRAATAATVDWEGLARLVFETDVGHAGRELASVGEQLLALAQRIEAAAEAAVAEQARRERQRERWREEQAAADGGLRPR
jgi:hypothetical protein